MAYTVNEITDRPPVRRPSDAGGQKENAMDAVGVLLILVLVRLVLPVGSLLLIGQWVKGRKLEPPYRR